MNRSEFRLVLRIITGIIYISAALAVVEAALDAWLHQPLAEFLVHRFGDVMLMAVGAVAGLLAGRKLDA